MPYKILVIAKDRPDGLRLKGDMSIIRPVDWEFGTKEGLPNFVQVAVTDGATWQNAQAWIDSWRIQYVFTTLNDQPTYAQYKVEVDPDVISASGVGGSELKQEMRDYIEDAEPDSMWYGSVIDGFTASSMTVTIPKPHVKRTLKNDFMDKFETKLGRRYYFKSSGVDWAIAQGGAVSITQAQAINNLIDKLTE